MKKKLVISTGAGISAESGISTFRDADGLWENYPVMDVCSAVGFARNPAIVHKFYNARRKGLLDCKPNAAHLSLVELEEDYEKNTGKIIVETFQERCIEPTAVPGVICASHGPFTWGKDAAQAVNHAVVMEEVARMAILTRQIRPSAGPAPQRIQDKHYFRKHGPSAYYGQS